MDYQIVATLGPSSDTESTWQSLLAAGATAFRLNTSHLSDSQLNAWVETLDRFLVRQAPRPSLILDLQGSKWRLGRFPACQLVEGERVTLVCAECDEHPGVLPVPHRDFFRAAPMSSGEIVLDDAKLRLRLESLEAHSLGASVMVGGPILPRKGITYTASTYRQECLSETDRKILEQTQPLEGIRYALSYVKDAAEMTNYRRRAGRGAFLIAKLEREGAVEEAMQIAGSANELWLCRGDLGAEMGPKAMAGSVYRFSERVSTIPVPVLLAGQVFEHMAEHSAPTRSEVCDLFSSLMRGYQGVVLSGETAIGRHPVEACRVAALFRT